MFDAGHLIATRSEHALLYGLVGREPSNNPFTIVFAEWSSMMRDLRNAKSGWTELLLILFGAPRVEGEPAKEIKTKGRSPVEA
ncbi:MAG: hypothetical protein HC850_00410 [Rhodomicrobium sp.]|nr:hypothetical protein [Rhodomicrobium sp.]